MAFTPAKFIARRNCMAAKLRYAVRNSNSKRSSPSVVFLILKAEAAKAGLTPDTLVRLDFDKSLRLGRLTPITSGVRRVREMKGSVCIQFPHNGDLLEMLPRVNGTCELTISEQSKTDGLTFELPRLKAK